MAIHVFNLGVMKNSEFHNGMSGTLCGAYLQYLYSTLITKYGKSVLPLKMVSISDNKQDYYAVFDSVNGAWLDFDGGYDPNYGDLFLSGTEGPCYLDLDYHPPEAAGDGF